MLFLPMTRDRQPFFSPRCTETTSHSKTSNDLESGNRFLCVLFSRNTNHKTQHRPTLTLLLPSRANTQHTILPASFPTQTCTGLLAAPSQKRLRFFFLSFRHRSSRVLFVVFAFPHPVAAQTLRFSSFLLGFWVSVVLLRFPTFIALLYFGLSPRCVCVIPWTERTQGHFSPSLLPARGHALRPHEKHQSTALLRCSLNSRT